MSTLLCWSRFRKRQGNATFGFKATVPLSQPVFHPTPLLPRSPSATCGPSKPTGAWITSHHTQHWGLDLWGSHTHTYPATGLLAGSTLPLLQWLQTPVIPLTCKPGSGSEVSQQRLVGTKWAVKGSSCWEILAGTNSPSSISPWYSNRASPHSIPAQQCTVLQSRQWSPQPGVCCAHTVMGGPDSLKPLLLGPGPHSQSTQTHWIPRLEQGGEMGVSLGCPLTLPSDL